ncbi:MAG: nodulation protein NfeD [Sulfuritalea sp.]|nr:nodulation protein NfeD [Sulfuritalea sp.]
MRLLLFLLGLWFASSSWAASVHVLSVRGAIGPASADFVARGIEKAIAAEAKLVVIELDTPGGLDTSMRDIIKAILASRVPVATYVAPQGARAASAGTYILYASHIAAMAPATNLGAATPVELMPGSAPGGVPEKKGEKPAATPPQDARTKKAVNDASAYIRGLAELRGRNVDWAERAVREGVSLSADAALKQKVVDVVAADLGDLLKQVHGRKIKLATGEITLDTVALAVTRVEPDWRSRLLAVIGDPSIAYVLLLLGIYGLIYEFMNPGMLFPGVVGGICLLLALFALQLMPVSYVGLALIILGVAMMLTEAFLPSFGVLGLGGIVAFVLGSVMLIDTDLPGFGVSWMLIAPLAGVSALLSIGVGGMVLRARGRPVLTGTEAMAGSEGEVLEDIEPGESGGWARVHGERWRVRSRVALARGTRVRVGARHGLTLDVEPIDSRSKESEHV